MSRFTDRAVIALAAEYAEFGEAAIYTAPNNTQIACSVILDQKDSELGFGRGQPMIEGRVLEVRASEVGDLKSAKGGSFTITETAETLKIIEDPRCEDADRLVWTMTVR